MHTPMRVVPKARVSTCSGPNATIPNAAALRTPPSSGTSETSRSQAERKISRKSRVIPTSETVEIRCMSRRASRSEATAKRCTPLRSSCRSGLMSSRRASKLFTRNSSKGPWRAASNAECRVVKNAIALLVSGATN
jgi:hypothetical protein